MPDTDVQEQVQETVEDKPKLPESPTDWTKFDDLSPEEQNRLIEEAMSGSSEVPDNETPEPESEEEEPTPEPSEPAKPTPKPQAPAPAPEPAMQQQVESKIGKAPDELPDELLQVDYGKYMPEGEDYDPQDATVPGTASNRAWVKGNAALAGRVQDYRQQQRDRLQMQEMAEREFNDFVQRNPDMQSEEKKREYLDFLMTSMIDGEQMSHDELKETMAFIRHRRKQRKTSGQPPKKSGATAPVTSAPSSGQSKVESQEDLQTTADSIIGPEGGF